MLVRVNRHSGEVKKVMTTPVTRTGADGSSQPAEGEHKILGIETRVLVAAGLLGVLTYGMFAYDPVPRKSRPKGLSFGDEPAKDKGYARRKVTLDEAERQVVADEAAIDEEFEATDVEDEDEEDVEEEEDE